MKQKSILFLLSFSFLTITASEGKPKHMSLAHIVDDKQFESYCLDELNAQMTRLEALLKSELKFDDEQVLNFGEYLINNVSEGLTKKELTIPMGICNDGENNIDLPIKIIVVCAAVLNVGKLCKGFLDVKSLQQTVRGIELHLKNNPDTDVRKVTYKHLPYFTLGK